jgi:YidC/Oxa1 family membrane protein insertase
MQKQPNNFLDPKTLLAIFLSGLVFVLYSSYLNRKFPKQKVTSEKVTQNQVNQNQVNQDTSIEEPTTAKKNQKDKAANSPAVDNQTELIKEQILSYEDENLKLTVSSKGMGIKNVELKKYTDRNKHFKTVGYSTDDEITYQSGLLGRRKTLNFDLKQEEKGKIVGTAIVDGMKIIKSYNIDSRTYSLNTSIRVIGATDTFEGIETLISTKVEEPKSSGFLPGANFGRSQVYTKFDTTDEREYIPFDETLSERYERVSLVSLGEHYFSQALVDRSKNVIPDLKVNSTVQSLDDGRKFAHAVAKVQYPVIDRVQNFDLDYVAYLGPNSFDTLKLVDAQLTKVIDYGFFSFLAEPLLKLLKWFDDLFGNWGVAIIFLTIVVRFVLLPLHMVSYRSMKNMSKISPVIKEINEKYKDDPQVRGQKMMEVYKEYKVNPLSGCLPMVLQIPVFFALYQVIGQSIELYQAPFAFWIQDLSLADPFYILPILMGVTMMAQMKLTPSTMDPKQAKIMMFMPLLFTFFMLPLPSGLTLYFFISGLFGIIQQYLMRDRSTTQTSNA